MIEYITIVEALINSELLTSNLFTSKDSPKTYENVSAAGHKRISTLINRSLVNLSTRFMLEKKDVYLVNVYRGDLIDLREYGNSVTDNSEGIPVEVIRSTNIIEVLTLSLLDKETGKYEPIHINDGNGISQLTYGDLNFNLDIKEDSIFKVTIWVMPQLIDVDSQTQEEVDSPDINISYVYLNAIIYYVAMGIYQPTLTSLDVKDKLLDINYAQKYEAECQMLLDRGVDVDNAEPAQMFSQRGFI